MLVLAPAVSVFSPAHGAAEGTHSIPWARLKQFAGKYPSDKPVAGALNPTIRSALKTRAKEFFGNFQVQTPMVAEDGVLICSGMQAHSGGENAAFAYFEQTGKLLLVIKTGTRFEYFGAKGLAAVPSVAANLKSFS